ncbi:unnamed protein product, partial [Mesorhabditis belari]|uniref:Uncharacterized protein n=1 Tax=Mesorhabditis belari TaxID=2138241 RepID=A0AAF3EHC7_9BILA
MDLQLLTRPKCYRNSAIEVGPGNAWPVKCYYFRKVNSFPRFRFGGSMSVYRSQLYLKSKFPDTDFLIDLVSIGYIESDSTLLDIRGCHFRLMISLGEFCENVRDWLRVVVLRSRVPHTLLGRKLDWQIEKPECLDASTISPLSCFKFCTKNRNQQQIDY